MPFLAPRGSLRPRSSSSVGLTAFLGLTALLAAPLGVGCSSDDSASGVADAATSDAPLGPLDAATDAPVGDAAAPTADVAAPLVDAAAPGEDAGPHDAAPPGEDAARSDGGCARPINGVLVDPTGSASVALTAPANASTTSPGTVPCAGTFDPASGTANGPGQVSGRFTIECIGHTGTAYYGFRISSLAKPAAGQSFPVGTTGSVRGDGGFYPNGEADFDYEEGDSCRSKTGVAKTWNSRVNGQANPVTGSLSIDGVTGQTVAFHFSASGVPASAGTLATGALGVGVTAGSVVVSGL